MPVPNNRKCLKAFPDLWFRLRNDLYCVEWGVKLYSLTHWPLILYGRWGTVHWGNAIETESALTVYTVMVPGYNMFFAFQTPVGVTEPNPDWSTVWLRERLAAGVRDYSIGGHNHKQGPDPESPVCPPLIFHFNHCCYCLCVVVVLSSKLPGCGNTGHISGKSFVLL